MTRFYIHIFIIIGILLGITAVPVSLAYENQNQDVEEIIVAVIDGDLTEEEKFTRAYESLSRALNLSLNRVNSISDELHKREFEDGSVEKNMQTNFFSDLEEYNLYYNEKLSELETLTTLDDVKKLATEIKIYRDTTYTPSIENIVRFTLVFYNRDILDIANTRLNNITSDINELKEFGLFEEEFFLEELENAANLLNESNELQISASNIILNLVEETSTETIEDLIATATISIDEGVNKDATSSDSLTEEVSTENIDEEYPKNSREMLEKSLSNIKEVYSIFLNISNEIQNALGID